MTDNIFTSSERKTIEALAQRRGFESLDTYVRALVKQDAAQHGESVEIEIEESLGDPIEDFKQGWADAHEGRTMSREEFRRRMSENA